MGESAAAEENPRTPAGQSGWLTETALERDEHAAAVLGFRRAAVIGMAAWPLFGLVDWFIVTFVEPGRLWVYLTLRAIGMVLIAAATARLFAKPPPSPRLLRFLDVLVFAATSTLVSASAVEFGGITTPLSLGVVTILACRSATVPDRWQRSLLPVGVMTVAHPVTLLSLALVSPEVAAQLGDGRAVGAFVLNQVFVFGTAAITVAGSHAVWALRRKVYETRSLGRYRLKRRIGRGGMGEVWAAHHNTLRRDVAVKILRPDRMDDGAKERFEREVRATSELSHPNTVRVFDYGVTDDGLCYYAMELLDGEDLGTVVKRDGPIPAPRVVHLMIQTAKALAEAHRRGIVHRDVKPENIFVTRAGDDEDLVKVLDFGLARLTARDDADTTLTNTGFVVGTPAYIAPELLAGRSADARTDVYALGAVTYKLLTGRSPFAGRERKAMLLARMKEDPKPLSELLEQRLPRGLEEIVLRSLRRDPRERYASAAELARALEACAEAMREPHEPDAELGDRPEAESEPETLVDPEAGEPATVVEPETIDESTTLAHEELREPETLEEPETVDESTTLQYERRAAHEPGAAGADDQGDEDEEELADEADTLVDPPA